MENALRRKDGRERVNRFQLPKQLRKAPRDGGMR